MSIPHRVSVLSGPEKETVWAICSDYETAHFLARHLVRKVSGSVSVTPKPGFQPPEVSR